MPTKMPQKFSLNVAQAQQMIVDAVNANGMVLAFSAAITKTQLPVLDEPPTWWGPFEEAYTTILASVNLWPTDISNTFIALPQSIADASSLFTSQLNTAQQFAQTIQSSSGEQQKTAIADLKATLATLLQESQAIQSSTLGMQTQISSFSSNLNQDLPTLSSALSNANNTVGIDQQTIEILQTDIQNLQNAIAEHIVILTIAEGAVILGNGTVVFAIEAAPPWQWAIAMLGLLITALGEVTLLLEAKEIKAERIQLANDIAQLGPEEQTVGALNSFTVTLQNIIKLANNASSELGKLNLVWSDIETDVSNLLADITQAESDLTQQDFSALVTELQQASQDWQTLNNLVQQFVGLGYKTLPTAIVDLHSGKIIRAAS